MSGCGGLTNFGCGGAKLTQAPIALEPPKALGKSVSQWPGCVTAEPTSRRVTFWTAIPLAGCKPEASVGMYVGSTRIPLKLHQQYQYFVTYNVEMARAPFSRRRVCGAVCASRTMSLSVLHLAGGGAQAAWNTIARLLVKVQLAGTVLDFKPYLPAAKCSAGSPPGRVSRRRHRDAAGEYRSCHGPMGHRDQHRQRQSLPDLPEQQRFGLL